MNAVRKLNLAGPVSLCYGTFVKAPGNTDLVKTETGLFPATRAAGCLLTPEEGDRVLISFDGSSRAYVLNVLERASESPAQIGMDAGFSLTAGSGRLALNGDQIEIQAAARLRMTAPDALVEAGRLSLAGDALTQTFRKVCSLFGAVESSVGRVVERIRRLHRRVEDTETAEIGRLRVTVEESLRFQAREASLTTEEDLSLDGRHIHLG